MSGGPRKERARPKAAAARSRSKSRSRAVLVFGEDTNDTKAIRELIAALRPDLADRVKPLRQPQVLLKNARPEDIAPRAERIAAAVRAMGARVEVTCVFAHEDCDALEPAHEPVCVKIEEALANIGCPAHAVVPAWEIEAWWFLWPEAVKHARSSWRAPDDFVGKEVGRIRNAKEELQKRVIPLNLSASEKKKFITYQESDAPSVAAKVRENGWAEEPKAHSSSYDRFRVSVASCEG